VTVSLLFFDLDDTLVDHRSAEAGAQRETHERFSRVLAGVSFETWLAAYRPSNVSLWAAFARSEVTREELQHRRFQDPLSSLGLSTSLSDEMGTFYLRRYRDHWQLNEGAEEILDHASRNGVVGLLSNGFSEQQWGKVRRFRLDRWAKHVVLSEEVGAMKPSRVIFDAAWKAGNGSEPGRKVYVGDSFEHDVVGAKAAGWLPILYWPNGGDVPAPVLYVRRLVDLKPLLS
jgi:HAD superfamily hydrolase (TIGR01549 family)